MIALIKGTVEKKQERELVVTTTAGVGYRIGVKPEVLSHVSLGQAINLHIFSYIREDAFDLYGFLEESELRLFELLLTVSGVGPKTALAVMSSGSVEEITAAIAKGDAAFFTETPGIGTKGAQRIIVDLRAKVGAVGEFDLSEETRSENKEIIEALRGFGFSQSEARQALKSLPRDENLTIEQKVKRALKNLSH